VIQVIGVFYGSTVGRATYVFNKNRIFPLDAIELRCDDVSRTSIVPNLGLQRRRYMDSAE
jgi:hypothetical protein